MKAWLRFKQNLDQQREAVTSFVRFTAIAFVVVIMIIAVGEATRTDDASRNVAPATLGNDPLAFDLARCRDITAEQMSSVDTCRRVWAENRKRFFAPSNKPAEVR